MSLKRKKGLWVEALLVCIVFCCIYLITAFVCPKVDEYIFSTSTELNFDSIFSYALNYGNGRLIGNIVCIFFSHLFEFRTIIISLVTTSIVFVLYRLYFRDKIEMFIPIAILVLFMPRNMFSSVLLDFPSFINYVVPLLLFLIVYAVLNDKLQIKSTVLKFVVIIILGISVCLFSENTTGIVFLAAVLFIVGDFWEIKRIKAQNIVLLFAAIIGCLVMLIIPRIMGVEKKLESYRAVTFAFTDVFGNIMFAADIINDFILVFLIISLGLGYITIKLNKVDTVNCVCMVIMGLYTIFSLLVFSHTNVNTFVRLINLVFTVIYCIATVVLIMRTTEKSISKIILLVLAVASVGPMTFVNILSYRTFYITYVLLLLMALEIFSDCVEIGLFNICLDNRKKCLCTAVFVGFITIFSVMQFEIQLEGFCKYVIKNENEINDLSIEYEEKFGYGLSADIYSYALENQKYFNPKESVIWTKDTWVEALR